MATKTPAKKAAAKHAAPKGNILKYLEKLPSPYKEMAIYNYHKQKFPQINDKVSSLFDAIINGFEWCKTDQGDDFWQEVYDVSYYGTGCEYPEIPDTTKTKTWSGIVPDYNIVVDKKKSIITVGCQEIDLDTFKQFVQEFNEFTN